MSNFYKSSGDFTPTQIVPKGQEHFDDWQPIPIKKEDHPISDGTKVETTDQPSTSLTASDPAPDRSMPEGTAGEDRSAHDEAASEAPVPPLPDIETIQQEAFNAGVEQGRKQVEEDFGSTLSALTQLCEQLNTIRETILKNAKDEIIELVLTLSEKIIRHSVTEQHQTVIHTVESAISQAVKSGEFYIYVHPDDLNIIQERATQFVAGVNGLDNVIVKSDATIERGGCKVESENCTVDATISSQFKVLQKSLKQER